MSLSVRRRKTLPSEQALDVMVMLKRSHIASMELCHSRFHDIAGSNAKALPLHFLRRLNIRPTYKLDANADGWGNRWPSGATWEVAYGHSRRPSPERPDRILRPFSDVRSAWNLFCELLKRTCICDKIEISFVNFTPGLVQMFVEAEQTGRIMQRCRTIAFRGTNEDLFRESIAATKGFPVDHGKYQTESE